MYIKSCKTAFLAEALKKANPIRIPNTKAVYTESFQDSGIKTFPEDKSRYKFLMITPLTKDGTNNTMTLPLL